MRIDIMVNGLEQLQNWVTKTQEIAEKLSLPVFQFDFGTCKRCETVPVVRFPMALDVNEEDERFVVMCHECGIPLE